jgi:hypothetical protein
MYIRPYDIAPGLLGSAKPGLAGGQHHRGGDEGGCRLFARLAIGGAPKICPGWLQRSGDGDR